MFEIFSPNQIFKPTQNLNFFAGWFLSNQQKKLPKNRTCCTSNDRQKTHYTHRVAKNSIAVQEVYHNVKVKIVQRTMCSARGSPATEPLKQLLSCRSSLGSVRCPSLSFSLSCTFVIAFTCTSYFHIRRKIPFSSI